ncbi:hypothetical protein N9L47_11330 [Rhodobacteraceae bacterium]|nr:hypothetical protein [Paracoccaceae bacterium]
MDRKIHIVRANSTQFLAAVAEARTKNIERTTLNYLLCKVALVRRRQELAELRAQGLDTAKMERLVGGLETSLKAHGTLIKEL